ncbi:MAG: DUF6089 family protein [Chitinophagales bacterium]
MKPYLIFFLLAYNSCLGQSWMGEVMTGISAYNGDLTQQLISAKRFNPAFGFHLKYTSGDFVDLRIGIEFEKVSANDKDNKSPFLKARNLSFKSNILEFNVGIEFNLADPQIYDQYPYLFAGIGIFHFNPYTSDNNNKKTYLQPLSTEGEGLSEYPSRKPYSLTQPCIPLGVGFKWKPNDKGKLQFSYEFGYRILFTDYLDDVSKTYVSIETLGLKKGPESAALSYRKVGIPFSEEGFPRGNPKVKDYYFFTGLKLAVKLGKK